MYPLLKVPVAHWQQQGWQGTARVLQIKKKEFNIHVFLSKTKTLTHLTLGQIHHEEHLQHLP